MKRLEYNATTRDEVETYFQTRAKQILSYGFIWNKQLHEIEGGFETKFYQEQPNSEFKLFKSFYILDGFRNKGLASKAIQYPAPVVTVQDCDIAEFLTAKQKEFVMVGEFFETDEYKAVQDFYGDRKAERSQCYLMNHIDEGIYILHRIRATESAMKAFCLHPLIQSSDDLAKNWEYVKENFSAEVIGLTMEYRNIANAYLSHRTIGNISEIELSPLKEVNDMLIADKIQNYADFVIYHSKTHPRKEKLDEYFNNWLQRLDISIEKYNEIVNEFKSIEN